MSKMKPLTRPATSADLEALIDMRQRLQDHMKAGTPDLFDLAPNWRVAKREFYRDCLEDPERRLAVLRDGPADTILGMGLGSIVENPAYAPNRFGAIDDLWVTPERRRQGLGRMIIADLMGFFARHGLDHVTLSYGAGNEEAKAFWASVGFRPVLMTATGQAGQIKARL